LDINSLMHENNLKMRGGADEVLERVVGDVQSVVLSLIRRTMQLVTRNHRGPCPGMGQDMTF
jgi:hypothetical protein